MIFRKIRVRVLWVKESKERDSYYMDIIQKITQELKVEKWQVEAAVKLIDEGNKD